MKFFFSLTLALLQCLPAQAAPGTLQFAASIQDENLAEEAIQLLHCLSERSGAGWEFATQVKGKHWLKAEEKGGALRITYSLAGKEQSLALHEGDSEAACDELFPEQESVLADLAPAPAEAGLPFSLEAEKTGKPAWPWIAAVGAAAVAGFFIWKGRQPEHRSLLMN